MRLNVKNSDDDSNIYFPIYPCRSKADMEKVNFVTQARFEPKLFYPKKCVNCNKSDFATKQRKIYLATIMSKIRLPQIYRSNNYGIN